MKDSLEERGEFEPEVRELRPAPRAVDVFRALSDMPHCIFLDSAQRHPQLGRYSYVTASPFSYMQCSETTADPLRQFQLAMESLDSSTVAGLPPFQGGAAGLFGYDLNRTLERLPRPRYDDFHVPPLSVGLYDVVVAFDHQDQQAWIISQGWPASSPRERRERAAERLSQFVERINGVTDTQRQRDRVAYDMSGPSISPRMVLSKDAPSFPVPGSDGLLSNFTADGFRSAVATGIDAIRAGDIFQVNLAQRLLFPAKCSATQLYLNLREENPAPFAGYFDLGDWQIVSASPERFLQVQHGRVETRPIKGTRPRRRGAEADLFAGDDLQASEKDLAENVMIVDLMRNDLSRVCDPDSVTVTQLCELESYQYVQHLVSVVTGRLSSAHSSVDLVRAAFPGGSITGAPKVRAMEIIAQIEPHARGAYCGSLGFVNWDGSLDLNILIRTITSAGGWWQFPVGGGIVAQSDPHREYEETWHKAEGLLRGMGL